MSTERTRISRRTLIITSLLLLGSVGAGLLIWWQARAVGDRPIIVKGGSLSIESQTPFDSDGYNKIATGHLDHKITTNQIKCVKMMQNGQKLYGKQCEGKKCTITIIYADPNKQDDKTDLKIESVSESVKSLRISSHPVKLEDYDYFKKNMEPPGPKMIKHPDRDNHGLKKLLRVEIKRASDLVVWPCPPNGNSYNCTINIEYIDRGGEAACDYP